MSQNWKLLVDDIKIEELVYSASTFRTHFRSRLCSRRPWYLTKDEINPGNIIDLYPISKLSRCPLDLTNVHRLRIDTMGIFRRAVHEFSWNLNWNEFLGNFPKLTHLEIYRFGDEGFERMRRIYLRLPVTLKTFRLTDARQVMLYLKSSPQLENVSCDLNIANIQFSHPESVKHLRINDWIGYHLRIFSNVEYIHFGRDSSYLYDELNLIWLFPQVKEIHFDYGAMRSAINVRNLERVLHVLMAQKNVLGRNDLTIFYDGTMISDVNSFRVYIAKIQQEYTYKRNKVRKENYRRKRGYRSKSC